MNDVEHEIAKPRDRSQSIISALSDVVLRDRAWTTDEVSQVGLNKLVIDRRGTKIILEEIPDATDQKVAKNNKIKATEHHPVTWLLSGLYAMLLFDVGLVMKVSQFIAPDITIVEFYWFFIIAYSVAIIWMILYKPLATSCYKHKESMSFARSNHANNRWLKGVLALFGLAIIVKNGLEFIAFCTLDNTSCPDQGLFAALPACNSIFIIMQVYYLFEHSKVFTQDFQGLTRFGNMHLIAINLIMWTSLVIDETFHALHKSSDHESQENNTMNINNGTQHNTDPSFYQSENSRASSGSSFLGTSCSCSSSFCSTVTVSQTFLFPFVVEFSLVASCLLYITWRNVGRVPPLCEHVTKPSYKLYKSYKGVACGLVVVFATILVLIIVGTPQTNDPGNRIAFAAFVALYVYYIVLEVLMIIAISLGFFLFKKIHQDIREESEHLDAALFIICLIGPFVLDMFALFGIIISDNPVDGNWILSFIHPLVDVVQCTSQVIFLLIGLHRKPIASNEGKKAAEEIEASVERSTYKVAEFPEDLEKINHAFTLTNDCYENKNLEKLRMPGKELSFDKFVQQENSFDSGFGEAEAEKVTSFCDKQKRLTFAQPRITTESKTLESVVEEEELNLDNSDRPSIASSSSMENDFSKSTENQIGISQHKVKVVSVEKVTNPNNRRLYLRDIIMFLLISNACLWVFLSLEGTAFNIKSHQDLYYGIEVWTIISMICRPLIIFFRMHSAGCLFEIWSFA